MSVFDLLFGGDPNGEISPSEARYFQRQGYSPGAATNPWLVNTQPSAAAATSNPNSITPYGQTVPSPGASSNPWLNGSSGPVQGGYGDVTAGMPVSPKAPPLPPPRPANTGLPPNLDPTPVSSTPQAPPATYGWGQNPDGSQATHQYFMPPFGQRPEGNEVSGWGAGSGSGGVPNPLAGNGANNFASRVLGFPNFGASSSNRSNSSNSNQRMGLIPSLMKLFGGGSGGPPGMGGQSVANAVSQYPDLNLDQWSGGGPSGAMQSVANAQDLYPDLNLGSWASASS